MYSRAKEVLQMPPRKSIRLQNLQDGDPFVIESLKSTYELMYLIRAGESTCKVQGYKQTDTGGYSPFVDFFSPATMVYYDNNRERLQLNKDGRLTIPKEYLNSILNEEEVEKETKPKKNRKALKMSIENENPVKNGAGRPKKHRIQLPRGEEFTVGEIANKLGVKKFVINNEIAKIQRESPDILQVVGTLPQAKGKPARVFKLS
jgi:hypothetical protein